MSAVGRTTVGEVASRDDGLLTDAAFTGEPEDLKDLLAEGQERGYLTHEEIAARIDEAEVSEEQIREFHAHLSEHGVEVIPAELAGDTKLADGPDDAAQPV